MKRFVIAGLAGLMVFGMALGAAATLGVDSGMLQAGATADLSCDDNGVDVEFAGLETNDGTVTGVRVSDIHEDCEGSTLFANARDGAGGASLGRTEGVELDNSGEVLANWDGGGTLDAEAIEEIAVFIEK